MAEHPQIQAERRKKLLVDKKTQGWFIRVLFVIVVAVVVIFLAVTLLSNQGEFKPDLLKLLFVLLLTLVIVLIGVVFIGLRFSNKIVGPIYHIGRNLQLIQHGDYTSEVRLRRSDEFQNIAGIMNKTIERLRERVREDVQFAERIAAEIAKLNNLEEAARRELLKAIEEFSLKKQQYLAKKDRSADEA